MAADAFRSARLIYRAIEEDDAEDNELLHIIATDAEAYVNSNMKVFKPQNKKDTKQWKEHLLQNTRIAVIVCLPPAPPAASSSPVAKPTPIGVISLTGASLATAHNRNAYISIDISAAYQRRGYGSEAIEWVLQWGFQRGGLHRIAIESFSHSPGAGRLYEKLGFKPEGRKREAVWYNGGWSDQIELGMLEGEWKERRGSQS